MRDRLLNLEELLLVDEIKRNSYVLSLNNKCTSDIFTFSFDYGALCGGDTEGVLVEESQEILFELSDINIVSEQDSSYLIEQDNIKYSVGKTIGKEGVSVPSEHINFNKLFKLEAF